jgi:DNA-binding NarL/FixJ family response regulator
MGVTILLADDHPVMHHGLRLLLEAQGDFRIVAEAGDGLEATQLAERLRPCILIADVMMPGLNGLEVARQVGQRSPPRGSSFCRCIAMRRTCSRRCATGRRAMC